MLSLFNLYNDYLSQENLSTGISNFFNEFFTTLYFFGFLTTEHAKKNTARQSNGCET